jgi:hypothetical protein
MWKKAPNHHSCDLSVLMSNFEKRVAVFGNQIGNLWACNKSGRKDLPRFAQFSHLSLAKASPSRWLAKAAILSKSVTICALSRRSCAERCLSRASASSITFVKSSIREDGEREVPNLVMPRAPSANRGGRIPPPTDIVIPQDFASSLRACHQYPHRKAANAVNDVGYRQQSVLLLQESSLLQANHDS